MIIAGAHGRAAAAGRERAGAAHEQAISGLSRGSVRYRGAALGGSARAAPRESGEPAQTRSFRTPTPTSARRCAACPRTCWSASTSASIAAPRRIAAIGLVLLRYTRWVRPWRPWSCSPSATPRASKPVSRPRASSPRLPRRASGQKILSHAMLLAAAGYRMAPSAQTLQAVYATATASPKADPFPLHAGDDHRAGGDAGRAHHRHRRHVGRDHPLRSGERCVDPHRDDGPRRSARSFDGRGRPERSPPNGRQVALFGRSSGSLPVARGRSILASRGVPDGSTVVIGGRSTPR